MTAFGVQDSYLYELARLWPAAAFTQSVLLLVVWAHGCFGIHYWLKFRPWYATLQPILLLLAIALPLAALAGFAVSGRAVAGLISDPAIAARVKDITHWPDALRRAARLVPAAGTDRLCRPAGADCDRHHAAPLRHAGRAEAHDRLCRRPESPERDRSDAARDQPRQQHPPRLRVRRPRQVRHLPRANRRRRRQLAAAGVCRALHAGPRQAPRQRAARLPDPAAWFVERDAAGADPG